MVYVKLFGDWEIFVNGEKVQKFTSKKALKLLFYLLLADGSRVSVKELADIFWEGFDEKYIHKNLNVQLYYIRKDLGIEDKHLRSEREYVYIDKKFFSSDYQEFVYLSKISPEKYFSENVKSVCGSELLKGLNDEWIEHFRKIVSKVCEEVYRLREYSKKLHLNILKAKFVLEHQLLTRERYFLPIAVKKTKDSAIADSKVRKGDIVIELQGQKIILLERGSKRENEVINGFVSRLSLEKSEFEVLEDVRVLELLKNMVVDEYF